MTRCPINANKRNINIYFNEDETKKIINNTLFPNTSEAFKMKADLLKIKLQEPLPKYLQSLFNRFEA